MLERIERVRGIGLLHDSIGARFRLQKITLIYSDNGRGKSTFSSIMRSLSINDPTLIAARKTIDGTFAPEVKLQFSNGQRVNFENLVWTESRPELLVFDADFVEKNVHSGAEVTTEQRKNLLEFALGEQAVQARAQVNEFTREAQQASEEVRSVTANLKPYHLGILLERFEALPAQTAASEELEGLNRRLVAANAAALIANLPAPQLLTPWTLNLDELFLILRTSLDDLHGDASERVQSRLSRSEDPGLGVWLSEGLGHNNGDNCPYCDQDITSNDLLVAYRNFFDESYAELKRKVSEARKKLELDLHSSSISTIRNSIDSANALLATWRTHLDIDQISFDTDQASSLLHELQELLLGIVQRKLINPMDIASLNGDETKAEKILEDLNNLISSTNLIIKARNASIEDYRAAATDDDITSLQSDIKRLEMTITRHSPQVIDLFTKLRAARAKQISSVAAKVSARSSLDTIMGSTLNRYETAINELLRKFGASFRIDRMGGNYRGGAPRSEYALSMRGRPVPLDGDSPSFATALSEGDKRTLAFAFFVASVLADPNITQRIVLIDDPMCSLDRSRRQHTKVILKQIAESAMQLIVLAHDIYFIRDLKRGLPPENGQATLTLFQMKASANDYTDFADLDIDQECESPNSRHHRLLVKFTESNDGDPREVGKEIRLLLEGYLHRRYPGLIPSDLMLGSVISLIEGATPSSPLKYAQPLVQELREINDYVGRFYHDTGRNDGESAQVDVAELKAFSERALDLVYGRLD